MKTIEETIWINHFTNKIDIISVMKFVFEI